MLSCLMWFTLIKVFYLTPVMLFFTILVNRTLFKIKDSDVPPFIFLSFIPLINFVFSMVMLFSIAIDSFEELREKYVG